MRQKSSRRVLLRLLAGLIIVLVAGSGALGFTAPVNAQTDEATPVASQNVPPGEDPALPEDGQGEPTTEALEAEQNEPDVETPEASATFSATPVPSQTPTAIPPLENEEDIAGSYVPDEILVKFKSSASESVEAQSIGALAASVDAELPELGLKVLKVAEGSVGKVIMALNALPDVEYAEPNYLAYALDTIPNDPGWSTQYGPANIQMPQAWEITSGSTAVKIAIIDTGVDLTHPDLAAKIVAGYDFVNNDAYAQDDHGHGTHVAGIAAAIGNNATGIAGVSWGARIMPVKVLNSSGSGSYDSIVNGIIWAADHGAKVINLSLGGSSSSRSLEDAINYAYNRGVTVVAAAGNSGDSTLHYPAAYANVIAVAAVNSVNSRASFSTYGDFVDIAAPGVGIYATLRGGYGSMSGTSMAAPHVAGVAALLVGQPQFNTPAKVRAAIEATALDLGDSGWDAYYGHGLVQAYNALQHDPAHVTPTPSPTATTAPINYSFLRSDTCPTGVRYNWVSITDGVNPTALRVDDGYVQVALPFTFNFNDQARSTVYISTNGYLSFSGDALTAFYNVAIPNLNPPNEYVAPFWSDLNPSAGGAIYYATLGQQPNRRFVVEWNGVPRYWNDGALTFQAILEEGSNEIIFQYNTLLGTNASGGLATVGIEYAGGRAGVQYSYNRSGRVFPGLALRFAPGRLVCPPTPAPLPGPALVQPGHRAVFSSMTDFSWTTSPDAASYQIQIDNDARFRSPERDAGLMAASYTAGVLPDGVYYWRVRSADDEGRPGNWSKVWSFTVDTTPPSAPRLSSPANGSNQRTAPRLAWARPASDVVRYSLQVAADADFTQLVVDATTSNTTFKPNLPYGIYFWRVMAIDRAGNCSPWSAERSFALTILQSPAAESIVTRPVVKWYAVSNARVYHLQVDDDPSFGSPEVDVDWLVRPSYLAGDLAHGYYYYRLRVLLAGNWSDWTPARKFAYSPPAPSSPQIVAPFDRAAFDFNVSGPEFAWRAVAPGLRYELQVDNNSNFRTPELVYLTETDELNHVAGQLPNGRYYWRVRGVNSFGLNGNWSKRQQIHVADSPAAPLLAAPASSLAIADFRPNFSWSPVSGATLYRFQLSKSSACTDPMIDIQVTRARMIYGKGWSDLSPGVYYWRAQARSGLGLSSVWSDCIPFSTPAVIAGAVRDAETQEGLPGVTVMLSDGPKVITDARGLYSFSRVNPGSYTLIAQGSGYLAASSSFQVDTGAVQTLDLALSPIASLVQILISPVNGETTADFRPAFDWQDISEGPIAYQVQVSTSSDCTNPFIDAETAVSRFDYPAASDDLVSGVYYWHVRAKNIQGHSLSWSDCTSFSTPAAIQGHVIDAFTNRPLAGATLILDGTDLNTTTLEDGMYTFPMVQPGDLLVKAGSEHHQPASNAITVAGGASYLLDFALQPAPPSVPRLLTPAEGEQVVGSRPDFSWQPAADDAASFRLQVCLAENCDEPWLDYPGITAADFIYPADSPDLPAGSHCWRVQAYNDAGGYSEWSACSHFTIEEDLPDE